MVKRCETKGEIDDTVFHSKGDNHWGAVLAKIFISDFGQGVNSEVTKFADVAKLPGSSNDNWV